jgi:hypothetical protein
MTGMRDNIAVTKDMIGMIGMIDTTDMTYMRDMRDITVIETQAIRIST